MKHLITLICISITFLSFSQKTTTTYLNYQFKEIKKRKAFYVQKTTTTDNKIEKKISFLHKGIVLKEILINVEDNSSFETIFWNNGNKRYETHYRNGKKEGVRITYYWNGNKRYESNFYKGIQKGIEKSFSYSGTLLSETYYKNGKKSGKKIRYSEGRVSEIMNYSNGKLNGPNITLNAENKTIDSCFYLAGKVTGLSVSYYDSGKLKDSVTYVKGKRNGLFKRFYETGELMDIVLYEQGKVIGDDMGYFKDGSIKDSTHYYEGKKNGTSVGYFSNGNLKWKTTYSNGKREGASSSFWKNGNPKRKEVYQNNEFISGECFTQSGEDTSYFKIEIQPTFPNGFEGLMMYLGKRIKYPQQAKMTGTTGKVYVQFIVEKDGSLSEIKTLRGIGEGCDEEAMRAVKNMPIWEPGSQKGKPVRVRFVLPVNFTLR